MNIDDIFAKRNTFTVPVEMEILGEKNSLKLRPDVTYRYLNQDQMEAFLDGEPFELDGEEVCPTNDLELLDLVLVSWKGLKVNGEEAEYNDDNRKQAMNHGPIRTPLAIAYMTAVGGGQTGGKRARRKN